MACRIVHSLLDWGVIGNSDMELTKRDIDQHEVDLRTLIRNGDLDVSTSDIPRLLTQFAKTFSDEPIKPNWRFV